MTSERDILSALFALLAGVLVERRLNELLRVWFRLGVRPVNGDAPIFHGISRARRRRETGEGRGTFRHGDHALGARVGDRCAMRPEISIG